MPSEPPSFEGSMSPTKRTVRYGESPPVGYWHSQRYDAVELLDYVPRGDSWFLSTSLPNQRSPKCEPKRLHRPASYSQESLFKALGRLPSVPVDHRLIIRGNTDDEHELRSILNFIGRLQERAGDFWVKDFDLEGNCQVYYLGESLDLRTNPTLRGNFSSDAIEWPEPWHAHAADDHEPCHTCPPRVKAPWRRFV
jgi:hypothetical protein